MCSFVPRAMIGLSSHLSNSAERIARTLHCRQIHGMLQPYCEIEDNEKLAACKSVISFIAACAIKDVVVSLDPPDNS